MRWRFLAVLAGASAMGLTPSLLHAKTPVTHTAPAPLPISPFAMATSEAALAGAMAALGEIGQLAMRDLQSKALRDFQGGRDTVVISTTTIIIVLLVVLILILVL